jgi:hypothetical protein
MNAYKFNGISGHLARNAIIKKLEIPSADIYKTVKSIDYRTLIIETKDGKKYELILIEKV